MFYGSVNVLGGSVCGAGERHRGTAHYLDAAAFASAVQDGGDFAQRVEQVVAAQLGGRHRTYTTSRSLSSIQTPWASNAGGVVTMTRPRSKSK